MITIGFLAFVGLSATVALADWRRGWLLAIVVGVLQDPVRKLVPGAPVYLTFSIVGVYVAITNTHWLTSPCYCAWSTTAATGGPSWPMLPPSSTKPPGIAC